LRRRYDGAEVVRRVRALDGLALVPAVFLSSERFDPAHPDASAGVVLKPFLMSDLAAALDFAVERPREIRDNGAAEREALPDDSAAGAQAAILTGLPWQPVQLMGLARG
jgi:hypothetical protein